MSTDYALEGDQSRPTPEEMNDPEGTLFRVTGDHINWDSPKVTIHLGVELPFWLLVPGGVVAVTVEGCTLRARIINDGVEITSGSQTTRSHGKTTYIGDAEGGKHVGIPVRAILDGGSAQFIRTYVEFETLAVSDAVEAMASTDKVRQADGHTYMCAFALGHLPFLNHLINSYRRCTVDPYTSEVSQWDVPTWFVRTPAGPIPVTIFPYPIHDTYPFFTPHFLRTGEVVPYVAATLEEVAQRGQQDQLSGEVEILDGWSLYFRGRYADSIRSFVTAIELLVEERTRHYLLERGTSPQRTEKFIRDTRNKFNERLDLYGDVSRRRLPGPVLHFVPYLNGFRLRLELERTREMRHDIVHAGRRLDDSLSKPMRRVAETSTWLYGWLSESDFAERHLRHYSYFSQHRGWPLFDFHIEATGIVVTKPEVVDVASIDESGKFSDGMIYSSEGAVGGYPQHLVATLTAGMYGVPDIEHFAAIAFAMLGLEDLDDSPPPPSGINLPYFDRYRFTTGDVCHLIFVVDTPEPMGPQLIKDIVAASLIRRREGLPVSAVVCVVNDSNEVPWQMRDYNRGTNEEFRSLIHACGLSVVRTDDLARLILGVRKYKWPKNDALIELLQVGLRGSIPPNATRIGHVGAYFPKLQVLGVELTGEVELALGQLIVVRLYDTYYQCEVQSMEQHNVAVERVKSGQVGIKTTINDRVLIGAAVYIVPPPNNLVDDLPSDDAPSDDPPDYRYTHLMTPMT